MRKRSFERLGEGDMIFIELNRDSTHIVRRRNFGLTFVLNFCLLTYEICQIYEEMVGTSVTASEVFNG